MASTPLSTSCSLLSSLSAGMAVLHTTIRSTPSVIGIAALFCFTVPALADTYNVTVDTSSISRTSGAIDFQFNPGPLVTQAATLQILSFMSNGTLANCAADIQGFCPTGDVTGTLPATVTFDNGTGFNDYFDSFTFGDSISFTVSLSGPALSSPDGVSTSGSSFAFSMFSNAAGTTPVLTTDTVNGFAYVVNVNLDGTTTATNFLPGASAVPEPGSGSLLGALAALAALFAFSTIFLRGAGSTPLGRHLGSLLTAGKPRDSSAAV
jgi:hypothetical protein